MGLDRGAADPACRLSACAVGSGIDLEKLVREERAHALATLIRKLGDWDVAEESLQDALEAALVQWPTQGVPASPRAWLIRTAQHKGIDALRRRRRLAEKAEAIAAELAGEVPGSELVEPDDLVDDRLRLLFTCCHPALAVEAQIALTLRTVCGLDTPSIARAFLVAEPTMAQRLVRAKTKIREARIPYREPEPAEREARLDSVLGVVYLIFNEGYVATCGETLVRASLCEEAIRLARLLVALVPTSGEALGLLALLRLTDARRATRVDARGDLVLLDAQDRSLWDRDAITEGLELVARALAAGRPGPYALQSAIAALHAGATRSEDTDWPQIVGLYDVLACVSPSPVVALNRAVAVAMVEGPEAGLELMDALARDETLGAYHLLPAARADLLRRLGRLGEAASAYDAALARVRSEPERRFLTRRRASLGVP